MQTKRSRGRPKGSSPFKEKDISVLKLFAKKSIKSPYDLQITKFLKYMGYTNESERSRLRARWRRNRDQLLEWAEPKQMPQDTARILDKNIHEL